MWWIPLAVIAGYLIGTRCTYGYVSWRGMCVEEYDTPEATAKNTHVNRLFTAWVWPLMLVILLLVILARVLTVAVTGGWRR